MEKWTSRSSSHWIFNLKSNFFFTPEPSKIKSNSILIAPWYLNWLGKIPDVIIMIEFKYTSALFTQRVRSIIESHELGPQNRKKQPCWTNIMVSEFVKTNALYYWPVFSKCLGDSEYSLGDVCRRGSPVGCVELDAEVAFRTPRVVRRGQDDAPRWSCSGLTEKRYP